MNHRDHADGALYAFVLASIRAIALGVLCGTALHSGLTAALRRP